MQTKRAAINAAETDILNKTFENLIKKQAHYFVSAFSKYYLDVLKRAFKIAQIATSIGEAYKKTVKEHNLRFV